MVLKTQIKAHLSGHDRAYWTAAVLYEYALYPTHIWRRGLTRSALGLARRRRSTFQSQSLVSWALDLPACRRPQDLSTWLRFNGLTIGEGGHAFYMAPQDRLAELFPSLVDFYPEHSGFKILKDFRHPSCARYLYKDRNALRLLSRLIGSPYDQVIAANYLYAAGIGARVWDLTSWSFGDTCCTVFVVEHIDGTVPDQGQSACFLARLRYLDETTRLRVLMPRWQENQDFAPPTCNGNLIYSRAHDRAIYVDFQNFGLTDYSAWSSDLGSRDDNEDGDVLASRGWDVLLSSLQQHSQTLRGRPVLDVGCDSGDLLAAALGAGASWAWGWCAEDRAQSIELSLLARGATRFSVLDGVGPSPKLQDEIPRFLRPRLKDAVVFWSRRRAGDLAIAELVGMPWEILVWDGDVREQAAEFLPSGGFEFFTAPRENGSTSVSVVRRLPLP